MFILELQNITKRFSGLVAVNRVSFRIAAGEQLGIVGPNGSGKTTLYHIISGLETAEEGRIIFDGRDITGMPAHARANLGIARTFQVPRPFTSLTVVENVAAGALFGAHHGKTGVDEAMEIADRYIEQFGLKAHRSKMAGTLTPAEKKRMEIARALAMKPRLLLLDEVMAGMPPGEIDEMGRLLKDIRQKEGIALVAMGEHIMRAVTGFAERVIVMNRGEVLCDAPTLEALNDPRVVECYLGRKRKEYYQ